MIVFALALASSAALAAAVPREVGGKGARIATTNGVPTLEVDGAPFLLVGAQCDVWRSTRQDEKTVAFFDGYREMNATAEPRSVKSKFLPVLALDTVPDYPDTAALPGPGTRAPFGNTKSSTASAMRKSDNGAMQ